MSLVWKIIKLFVWKWDKMIFNFFCLNNFHSNLTPKVLHPQSGINNIYQISSLDKGKNELQENFNYNFFLLCYQRQYSCCLLPPPHNDSTPPSTKKIALIIQLNFYSRIVEKNANEAQMFVCVWNVTADKRVSIVGAW